LCRQFRKALALASKCDTEIQKTNKPNVYQGRKRNILKGRTMLSEKKKSGQSRNDSGESERG